MPNIPEKNATFSYLNVFGEHTMLKPHAHAYHELYYLKRGHTLYCIGDNIYSVREGNFVFVPQNVLHRTDGANCMRTERIVLGFTDRIFANDAECVLDCLKKERVIYIPPKHRAITDEILAKLKAEFNAELPFSATLFNIHMQELLTQICMHKQNRKTDRKTEKWSVGIQQYIRENYASDLSLKLLSKQFFMCEEHLSRKFKNETGFSITEFITYTRIVHSEKLLKAQNLSITEVAQQCGFNDSNYFSTVFKKIKGISPKQFALQHKHTL